jgi:hypothetical protein
LSRRLGVVFSRADLDTRPARNLTGFKGWQDRLISPGSSAVYGARHVALGGDELNEMTRVCVGK